MRGFRTSLFAAFLLCLPAAIFGQADSTASVSNTMPSNNFGFNLPSASGTLSYSLTGSQQFELGYSGGGLYTRTTLSGNLAYLSKSEYNPFSLVYSGGVALGDTTGNSHVQFYQDIAASQVYRTQSWVFVASDAFSYLPDSPTTGLSGVAGVGDVGIPPVQTGIGPGQSILTQNESRYTNGLSGSATWQTTSSLDLEGSATWQVMNFTGNELARNTHTIEGTFGPNYRIDARNSIGVTASYSRTTYPNYQNYLIESVAGTLNYSRAWSRRLSTTISLGPADTHGTTVSSIPGRIDLSGSASMTYATRTTGLYAKYDRSINAGSGVMFGALTDTATVGMSRPINRDWIMGLDLGYAHNAGLSPIEGEIQHYDTIFGGAQLSRRLTETLSIYGSYTARWQSSNDVAKQPAVFNGLNHIFSIGITFAPAPILSAR